MVWLSQTCAEILFEIEHLNLLYSMQKSIEVYIHISYQLNAK